MSRTMSVQSMVKPSLATEGAITVPALAVCAGGFRL
jgi:hypothetical protein